MLTFGQAFKSTGIAPVEPDKVSQASVDYTDQSASPTDRCAFCDMWMGEGVCSLVAGVIDPRGYCNEFQAEGDWGESPCTRSQMAYGDDPLVNAILKAPQVAELIDKPIVDRTQKVPYGAGGSVPMANPTIFIDPKVPAKLTASGVTYDPADPWVIHENTEQFVMEILIAAGVDPNLAYTFAHYCVAEVAEGGWYKYNGIDPTEAEAVEKPILDRLEQEEITPTEVNPRLYTKPYPHDKEMLARVDIGGYGRPTPAEEKRCRDILEPMFLGIPWSGETEMVSVSDVEKYLRKHAPDIAEMVMQDNLANGISQEKAWSDEARAAAAEARQHGGVNEKPKMIMRTRLIAAPASDRPGKWYATAITDRVRADQKEQTPFGLYGASSTRLGTFNSRSEAQSALDAYRSRRTNKSFDEIIQKDMGVGDAHVPTALGNERRRKRRGPPISTAYVQDDEDELDIEDDLMDEMDKKFTMAISKIDNEKQYIFGWASVCSVDGQLIVDKQGDVIPVDEIEKGAYEFVQFSRDMGDMHQRLGTGRMIESMVFTKEKAGCGVLAKGEDGKPIEGWWVGFHVVDPATWSAFKGGGRPELSIGGRASWEEA